MGKGNFLQIKGTGKEYIIDRQALEVLNDINLEVAEGEFISIVGISGCGKSTLLKIIAGLEPATTGEVLLDGKAVREPSLECGIVFQEPRLLPWATVYQNIDFGIPQGIGEEERRKRINIHLEMTGLTGFAKALPNQLSGGMQQRVSIARALAGEPRALLLDEPFGALDALTRIQMQREILRIWEAEKRTMILVTHDIDEAIFLGDRVVVMSRLPGRIQKVFPVEFSRPRSRTSEDFHVIRAKIYSQFFDEFDEMEQSAEYYL
jgi:sulfonate transport system ATP-binding protein